MRVRPSRIGRITDRYPFVGPALYTLAIAFFVAQVGVAYNWQSKATHTSAIKPYHAYSFFANTISDLGETSKFGYGTPRIWSPDHLWMNIAFFLLGAVMILGTPLLYQEFTEQQWRRRAVAVGFGLQALAGLGAILVGVIPENVNSLGHELGAGLAIAVGTAGVFVLGLSLRPLPGRIRRFMLWCSPVSLIAILLYALHEYLGFGPGGMERVAAYPEVIWLIMFGFYVGQSHYFYGSAHRPPNGGTKTASLQGRLRLQPRSLLPAARAGSTYSTSIGYLGGVRRGLPSFTLNTANANGLTLSAAGVLKGTPQRAGLVRLPISVAVDGETADKTFTVLIRRP